MAKDAREKAIDVRRSQAPNTVRRTDFIQLETDSYGNFFVKLMKRELGAQTNQLLWQEPHRISVPIDYADAWLTLQQVDAHLVEMGFPPIPDLDKDQIMNAVVQKQLKRG